MHAFDTHKYIKELQGTGFNEAQAEVIVKSLLESREYNFSKLATREQLAMLESSINNKLEALEGKMDFKIENLRNELKADIANAQVTIIKWMIPFFITIIGMITGLFIKLM